MTDEDEKWLLWLRNHLSSTMPSGLLQTEGLRLLRLYDGAQAERERILKALREPSGKVVDDVCLAGRNIGGPMPYSVARKVIAVILDTLKADPT